MTDSEPPIEAGTESDWPEIHDLLRVSFHRPPGEPTAVELGRRVHEPRRSLLVRDEGVLVAHATAFSRQLTVPGATLPAAHVSLVAVAATHRRRGLLNRLMRGQLSQIRAAGQEPVAVLWASEARIYPRYGYGLASQRLDMKINTVEVGPPAVTRDRIGRLRVSPVDRVRAELAVIHERLRPDRPGWSSRDEHWWEKVLNDPPGERGGATELRAVLHEGPAGPDGYALWRTRSAWNGWNPQGEVRVEELAAGSTEAHLALWQFLCSVDLTRTTAFPFAALDEPVQHLVAEPRQLNARLLDGLWVRVVDLPAALAARRYATPIDLVLEVTDPLLPENTGRWRLTGDSAGARCTATGAPGELALGVPELGAAFLGGPALTTLAEAGRVRELRPGALAEASLAFGWHRAPNAIEVF